jgi:hypothetical protein
MVKQLRRAETIRHVFDLLEGKWIGQGHGSFPTVGSFDFRETLTFERRDEGSLFYVQRTQKRPLGQTAFQTSHWESGFLRLLESGELELINSQSGGRSEVLVGTIEGDKHLVRLNFVSKGLMNDERMVATARRWEIEDDTMRYRMEMQTTRVGQFTTHLVATLRRVG